MQKSYVHEQAQTRYSWFTGAPATYPHPKTVNKVVQ